MVTWTDPDFQFSTPAYFTPAPPPISPAPQFTPAQSGFKFPFDLPKPPKPIAKQPTIQEPTIDFSSKSTRTDLAPPLPPQVDFTKTTTPPDRNFMDILGTFRTDPKTILPTIGGSILRGREKLAGVTTDPTAQFLFDKSQFYLDATTQKQRQLINQIENEVKSIEKTSESYNQAYGNRELTQEEYNIAQREGQRIQTRIEEVNKKIEKLPEDLALKAKESPLFERFSVAVTQSIGDVIGGAGFAVRSTLRPEEPIKFLADDKQVREVATELGRSAIQDPFSFAVRLGAGYGVSKFISKLGVSSARLIKSIKEVPKVSVSLGDVKAVKIPTPEGMPERYRVSATARANLINPKTNKIVAKVNSATESEVITAATKTEAVKAYVNGISASLSEVGAEGRWIFSGGTVKGKVLFNQDTISGLSSGRGFTRADDFILKGSQFVEQPPRVSIFRVSEKAKAVTPDETLSMFDTAGAGFDIRGRLGFTGMDLSKPTKFEFGISRDFARILTPDIKFDEPRVMRTKRRPKSRRPSVNDVLSESNLNKLIEADPNLDFAQAVGVGTARETVEATTRQVAKQIKKSERSAILRTKTRTAPIVTTRDRITEQEATRLSDRTRSGLSEIQRTDEALGNAFNNIFGLDFAVTQKDMQLQTPRLSQAQQESLKLDSSLASIFSFPTPTFAPPTTIEILKTPTVTGSRRKQKERPQGMGVSTKGYDVLVREKKGGGFIKITEFPIEQNQALDLLAFTVDNSLPATGKIRKSSKKARQAEFDIPPGYFDSNRYKFRDFQVRRGKVKPLKDTYIELERFRLDNPNEVNRLTAKRLLAQQKESQKFANDYNKNFNQVMGFNLNQKTTKTKTKSLKRSKSNDFNLKEYNKRLKKFYSL